MCRVSVFVHQGAFWFPLMHEVHVVACGKQLTEHLKVPCLLLRRWQPLPAPGLPRLRRGFDMKLGQQTR